MVERRHGRCRARALSLLLAVLAALGVVAVASVAQAGSICFDPDTGEPYECEPSSTTVPPTITTLPPPPPTTVPPPTTPTTEPPDADDPEPGPPAVTPGTTQAPTTVPPTTLPPTTTTVLPVHQVAGRHFSPAEVVGLDPAFVHPLAAESDAEVAGRQVEAGDSGADLGLVLMLVGVGGLGLGLGATGIRALVRHR